MIMVNWSVTIINWSMIINNYSTTIIIHHRYSISNLHLWALPLLSISDMGWWPTCYIDLSQAPYRLSTVPHSARDAHGYTPTSHFQRLKWIGQLSFSKSITFIRFIIYLHRLQSNVVRVHYYSVFCIHPGIHTHTGNTTSHTYIQRPTNRKFFDAAQSPGWLLKRFWSRDVHLGYYHSLCYTLFIQSCSSSLFY